MQYGMTSLGKYFQNLAGDKKYFMQYGMTSLEKYFQNLAGDKKCKWDQLSLSYV